MYRGELHSTLWCETGMDGGGVPGTENVCYYSVSYFDTDCKCDRRMDGQNGCSVYHSCMQCFVVEM